MSPPKEHTAAMMLALHPPEFRSRLSQSTAYRQVDSLCYTDAKSCWRLCVIGSGSVFIQSERE
jgi:hypothetical protein